MEKELLKGTTVRNNTAYQIDKNMYVGTPVWKNKVALIQDLANISINTDICALTLNINSNPSVFDGSRPITVNINTGISAYTLTYNDNSYTLALNDGTTEKSVVINNVGHAHESDCATSANSADCLVNALNISGNGINSVFFNGSVPCNVVLPNVGVTVCASSSSVPTLLLYSVSAVNNNIAFNATNSGSFLTSINGSNVSLVPNASFATCAECAYAVQYNLNISICGINVIDYNGSHAANVDFSTANIEESSNAIDFVVNSVCTITYGAGTNAGASASVTTNGFDFTFGIPKGDKGDTGEQGNPGATGCYVACVVGTCINTQDNGTSYYNVLLNDATCVGCIAVKNGQEGSKGLTGETGCYVSCVILNSYSTSDNGISYYNVLLNDSTCVGNLAVKNGSKGNTGDKGDTGTQGDAYVPSIDGVNINFVKTTYSDAPNTISCAIFDGYLDKAEAEMTYSITNSITANDSLIPTSNAVYNYVVACGGGICAITSCGAGNAVTSITYCATSKTITYNKDNNFTICAHTHNYTPSGSVTATYSGSTTYHSHTFSGTCTTISASATPSGSISSVITDLITTTKQAVASVGSLPAITTSLSGSCLTLSFSTGTLPTTTSFSAVSSFSKSAPTFTGCVLTVCTEYTPSGNINSTGITSGGSVNATFTGTCSATEETN